MAQSLALCKKQIDIADKRRNSKPILVIVMNSGVFVAYK